MQHRLVPEGIKPRWFNTPEESFYDVSDTIPCPSEWTAEEAVEILKITKAKWDEIFEGFLAWRKSIMLNAPSVRALTLKEISPSKYLSELISLAPLKGLTVEEIRELNKWE